MLNFEQASDVFQGIKEVTEADSGFPPEADIAAADEHKSNALPDLNANVTTEILSNKFWRKLQAM